MMSSSPSPLSIFELTPDDGSGPIVPATVAAGVPAATVAVAAAVVAA
jgi:hypothetical protein